MEKLLGHDETVRLIAEAQRGDMDAKAVLVESNIALVKSIVRGFLSRGAEYEDLVQIGSIGLLKAIDGFDASYGVRFSTYAVPMISGEIKRFLRDNSTIKVSRSVKENAAHIMAAAEKLKRTLMREPDLCELSRETGIPKEEISYALDAVREPVSMNAPAFGDEGELQDLIGESADDAIIDRIFIDDLMEKLPDRDRRIVALRFFRDKTQSEIASEIGLSQVQVSRIITRVMEKLKEESGA